MRSIFSTKKPPGNFKWRSSDKHTFALQFTAFWTKGCGEHRQMCWGDVQLIKHADGTEYLHFSERQTKTRSEADPCNVRPIKPKAFTTPDLPHEPDSVVVFKIYSEKRPQFMNKPDAPFYLGVNQATKKV